MPAKPDAETSSDRLFAAWAFNSDNVYSRKQNRWTGCCTPRESHMHGSAWSDEETADPLYADDRNFYKVELWTKDRLHVLRLLYAGNNLDRAKDELPEYARKRPRARLTACGVRTSSPDTGPARRPSSVLSMRREPSKPARAP